MPLPRKISKYVELDRTERVIALVAWMDKPTRRNINTVKCAAQVQMGIEQYQANAAGMTQKQLEQEAHDSQRLGAYMHCTGDMKPHKLCDAHAIVSGAHPLAAEARTVLAIYKLRIDDPFNGCWLPRNTTARLQMPPWLRFAVPHSRIHRGGYYDWICQVIDIDKIRDLADLIFQLKMIERKLQTSTFGPKVMNKGEK